MNQPHLLPVECDNKSGISMLRLFTLAFLVGIITGLGSIAFRYLVNLVAHFAFSGKIVFQLDANTYIPQSVWGAGVILVPVLGALLVTFLTEKLAPEAKGHGVSEVLYAIHYKEGIIRPIVAIVKSLASAISIGTGGAVGREGPIVQIGAAFGATLGQIIQMHASQRIILIAAGAGAGIAAIFNSPFAGVTFSIELILVSINAISVALVTIAVITATVLSYIFVGTDPAFIVNVITQKQNYPQMILSLLLFIPFGVLIGFVSFAFIYVLYWLEDFFKKLIKNHYLRHAFGMFIVGIVFYLLMVFYGQYYTAGVGDATLQDIFNHLIENPCFLLLLFTAKLLATCLTLGTGGSGGIFSPSLFLGATCGAFYAAGVHYFFPSLSIDPTVFVLAGMAGVVGGATSAFITAIVMIAEITQDYNSLLPMMMTAALAYFVRAHFSPESIYTLKVFRRGYSLPQGLQANGLR